MSHDSRLAQYLKQRAIRKLILRVGKAKLMLVAAGAGAVLILVLALLATFAGATSSQSAAAGSQTCGRLGGKGGPPPGLVPIYSDAATEYELGPRGPSILAAINDVESDFGRSPLPGVRRGTTNKAGAAGPMQFLYPSSWDMFGVDGNGDGVKDVYDPTDAIFAAANLLHTEGAPEDWYSAIFAYNHADWYVQKVERIARSYGTVECTAATGSSPLELSGSTGSINWDNLTLSNDLELRDIQTGALDDRIMALLALMTQEHQITISSLRSDHSKTTTSGGVSNHFYGRAMDIAAVDGVSCTNTRRGAPCARLGYALAQMEKPLHPTELIYCFDLDGAGPAFAAADHCDHVHAGFDG